MNTIIDKGIHFAQSAVEADQAGHLVAAVRDYRLACEYFSTALKYETGARAEQIRSKLAAYRERANVIDRKIDEKREQLAGRQAPQVVQDRALPPATDSEPGGEQPAAPSQPRAPSEPAAADVSPAAVITDVGPNARSTAGSAPAAAMSDGPMEPTASQPSPKEIASASSLPSPVINKKSKKKPAKKTKKTLAKSNDVGDGGNGGDGQDDGVAPESDESALLGFARELNAWLADFLAVGEGMAVPLRSVYEAYTAHCRSVGGRSLNVTALRSAVRQMFPDAAVRRVGGPECQPLILNVYSPRFPSLTLYAASGDEVEAGGGEHGRDRERAPACNDSPPGSTVVAQDRDHEMTVPEPTTLASSEQPPSAINGQPSLEAGAKTKPDDNSATRLVLEYARTLDNPGQALPFLRQGADLATTATELDKLGDDRAAQQYELAAAFLQHGMQLETSSATVAAVAKLQMEYARRAIELAPVEPGGNSCASEDHDSQGTVPAGRQPMELPASDQQEPRAAAELAGPVLQSCWRDLTDWRSDLLQARFSVRQDVCRCRGGVAADGGTWGVLRCGDAGVLVCHLQRTDERTSDQTQSCLFRGCGAPATPTAGGESVRGPFIPLLNVPSGAARAAVDISPKWCAAAMNSLEFYCAGLMPDLPVDLDNKIGELVRPGRLHDQAHAAGQLVRQLDPGDDTDAGGRPGGGDQLARLHYLGAYSDVLLNDVCELYAWLELRRLHHSDEQSGERMTHADRLRELAAMETIITQRLLEADSVELPELRAQRKRIVQVLHAADTVLDRAKSPAPLPGAAPASDGGPVRLKSPSPREAAVARDHAERFDGLQFFADEPNALRAAIDERIVQDHRQASATPDSAFRVAELTIDGLCVLFTSSPILVVLSLTLAT